MNVITQQDGELLVTAPVPCLCNGGSARKGMVAWRAAHATSRRRLEEDSQFGTSSAATA